MPRIPRGQSTAASLHVLNRSNDRRAIFRSSADYTAFIDLLRRTKKAIPLPIYAFTVMPNRAKRFRRPAGQCRSGVSPLRKAPGRRFYFGFETASPTRGREAPRPGHPQPKGLAR